MSKELTRRRFLKAGAAGMGLAAGPGLLGSATTGSTRSWR